MTGTPFTIATAVAQAGAGVFHAAIPDDWLQGRTAFGGLAAAVALRAVLAQVGTDRPVRSVDTTFVAPLPPGPVEVVVDVLREGRHATIVSADLRRDGAVCTRVVVVLGSGRRSEIVVEPPPPVPSKPREQGVRMPYIEGMTPAFTRHLELWLTEGAFPFAGNPQGRMGGFARLREVLTEPVDRVLGTLALLDAWPVPILSAATGPAAASSVRWSANLQPTDRIGEWVWMDYRTDVAADGYAVVWGRMYAEDVMLARSEQLAVIFDKPAG